MTKKRVGLWLTNVKIISQKPNDVSVHCLRRTGKNKITDVEDAGRDREKENCRSIG